MIGAVDLDVKIEFIEAVARNIVIEQIKEEFLAPAKREEEMRARRVGKAFPRSSVARRHGADGKSRVSGRELRVDSASPPPTGASAGNPPLKLALVDAPAGPPTGAVAVAVTELDVVRLSLSALAPPVAAPVTRAFALAAPGLVSLTPPNAKASAEPNPPLA
jgi:hypothetical protein